MNAPQTMQDQATPGSEFNASLFLVEQILAEINTACLVKIISCTNNGGITPVGFVDVQPMVSQLAGDGTTVPHATVHQLPYFRLQGGANAVIIDPQPGDIGIAVFCSRDISAVKSSKQPSSPGSYRQFSMSDGLYLGGFLNAVPNQYIAYSSAGIKIVSPTEIDMNAPKIKLTATEEIDLTAPTIKETATTEIDRNAPQINDTASAAINLTAPAIGLNGDVTQTGGTSNFTGNMGITGDVGVTGNTTFTGQVSANGKRVDDTHKHSGGTISGDTGTVL